MREVLAVTPLSTRPSLGQKLPVADARRRQGLRSFAEQVRNALEETDTRSAPASVVARRLDMTALRAALRHAGMSAESPLARLAREFPEWFELKTMARGGASTLSLTT
eukprot:5914225-Alexandrium_andersonii.AAC.1